jgi:magnesium transporter
MSYISYKSNITTENFDNETKPYIFSDEVKEAIIWENHYPLIEHHNGKDLFVIILPIYNTVTQSISLIECDILKDKEYCFVITDEYEESIHNIIKHISQQWPHNDQKAFKFLLGLCTHILKLITILEKKIILLKPDSKDKNNEDTINAIMQLKLDIGMFKSTTNPFGDIIEHLFDTITDTKDTSHEFKKNQLDHLITQIKSQSQFLYENISIVADTSNAIQNIHANNIMKILTIVSGIFIPLSFITGIFGMNFENMPWLDRIWRYYITMLGMFFIWLSQLYVFKKKWRF